MITLLQSAGTNSILAVHIVTLDVRLLFYCECFTILQSSFIMLIKLGWRSRSSFLQLHVFSLATQPNTEHPPLLNITLYKYSQGIKEKKL